MEVKVSNVSKLATKDVLKELFNIVGNVLCFAHYPNLTKRDGSYECDIVFSSIHEARLACRLDGTLLGDRSFTVVMQSDARRFRRSSASSRIPRLPTRCLFISGIRDESDIQKAFEPNYSETVSDFVVMRNSAVVELREGVDVKLTMEEIKGNGSGYWVEEAWRCIDPDFNPVMEKEDIESNDNNRSGSRSKSRNRSRSRSPSRDRERERDKRSKSYGGYSNDNYNEPSRHSHRSAYDRRR